MGKKELKGNQGSHPLWLFAGNRAWIELPGAQQALSPQLHEAWIVEQNTKDMQLVLIIHQGNIPQAKLTTKPNQKYHFMSPILK